MAGMLHSLLIPHVKQLSNKSKTATGVVEELVRDVNSFPKSIAVKPM